MPERAGQTTRARRLGRWLGVLGPDMRLDAERGPEWRLDYLFSIAGVGWAIHFGVVMLTGFVLVYGEVEDWVPWWTAIMSVLSLAMIAIAADYRRRTGADGAGVHGGAHSALTALAGLSWGGGALLCAADSSANMLSFYTLVLGGTALGAVSSQHVFMRSCLASLWTSVPLLSAAWLVNGISAGSLAVAGMMLLFGLMLTALAIRMNDFATQNVELANELVAKNAVLIRTGEKLAEAHEEKSRFLAQASHDLRQPIHAIGLFVEYLGGLQLGREGREVLGNIDRSLESLARLCRSLLDLSALDVGRVKPRIEAVPLGDVIGEVARQASGTARSRGVDLRVIPTRRWVRTDPALLHTMIQNLVSNAMKYAPGAKMLVGVRRKAGTFAVVVADTGPGIAPGDQHRIFQEFVQITAPGTEAADGLGLGLSIVRRLADMLGLAVTVRSQPGKGACFTIAGLEEAPPRPVARRRVPKHLEGRLKGVRVLVVDDDKPVLESTVHLLSRWGCSVRATTRADHVLGVTDIDFVLCDQELGDGFSGLDLVRSLRERTGTRLGAAIVTGGRFDNLTALCRAENIALMSKPVRPAQLRSALIAGLSAQTSPSSEAMPAAAERVGTSRERSSAET